jgi:hypothetical protein
MSQPARGANEVTNGVSNGVSGHWYDGVHDSCHFDGKHRHGIHGEITFGSVAGVYGMILRMRARFSNIQLADMEAIAQREVLARRQAQQREQATQQQAMPPRPPRDLTFDQFLQQHGVRPTPWQARLQVQEEHGNAPGQSSSSTSGDQRQPFSGPWRS